MKTILFGLSLLAFAAMPAVAQKPQRIVSTNLCTDQLLLRLVEPDRIASLTYLSWQGDVTAPELRPLLRGIKPNHGLAEEVLMAEPDLVVVSTFSARFTTDLLKGLGRNVLTLPPENSFEEWYATVRSLGEAVGEPQRAEAMIAAFQRGLADLKAQIPPGEMPVYVNLEVNNFMPGKDTLYQELVNAGGFRTAGEAMGFSGYRAIPLERLIRLKPDLISAGTAYASPPAMATEALRHPLLRRMASEAVASIDIPDRYVTCTTPETLQMIAQLVAARKQVDAARAKQTR